MSKYFVFMFIDEPHLRAYLNLAIYALNPLEKWPAHITIAGPYEDKTAVPRSLNFVQQISILGRGRFVNGSRQTVFLHAGSRDLQARMNKPDYPGAIPHLSLYSGHDGELADRLYERLADVNPFGVFHNRKLEVIESKEQFNFNLRTQINTSLSDLTDGMSLDELRAMPMADRVEVAVDSITSGFTLLATLAAEGRSQTHSSSDTGKLSTPLNIIQRFRYAPKTQELMIQFLNGRRFVFSAVPEDEAKGLRKALSKGLYFETRIRDRYVGRELRTPRAK